MIKVAIADDHALIREGLIRILACEEGLDIVIESESGNDLLKKMENESPDIVLLDMNMEDVDGITALKIIKDKWPKVKVIMLTVEKQKRKIKEALFFGAEGYVLKESAGSEITKAIKSVYIGQRYLDNAVVETLFIENELNDKGSLFDELTPKEAVILLKLSEGKKNKQIADDLYLSEKTIKNYVTSIFRKIDVEDRVQATLYAIDNNIREYCISKKYEN